MRRTLSKIGYQFKIEDLESDEAMYLNFIHATFENAKAESLKKSGRKR